MNVNTFDTSDKNMASAVTVIYINLPTSIAMTYRGGKNYILVI